MSLRFLSISSCDYDIDNDGVDNIEDNCPRTPNSNQTDSDSDGLGDVCDDCPHVYDPLQKLDDIGLPAACPGSLMDWDRDDTDSDGIPNLKDNCPDLANIDQADIDADGVGDICDPDIDGDGVVNENDDCPLIFNPEQKGNSSTLTRPILSARMSLGL